MYFPLPRGYVSFASPECTRWREGLMTMADKEVAMPEPGETGSVEESFRCPHCGEMYPTDDKDEGTCPVCGTHCTRKDCIVLGSSDVGF